MFNFNLVINFMFKVPLRGRIVVTFSDALQVHHACSRSNIMHDRKFQVPMVDTQLPIKVIQFVK
jgi:hypothetical protein